MGSARRASASLILLLVCALAMARTDKDESVAPQISGHLGLAGSPVVASYYFTPETRLFSAPIDPSLTLSGVYKDYCGPSRTSGTITGGVDVSLNRFLSMSVDLGVNFMWKDSFFGATGECSGHEKGVAVYLMPMCNFTYFKRPVIRLYGSAGVGVCKYFGYSSLVWKSADSFVDKTFKMEAQLVPFGFELGRKLFFYMELGLGTVYIGANAGIGYRF